MPIDSELAGARSALDLGQVMAVPACVLPADVVVMADAGNFLRLAAAAPRLAAACGLLGAANGAMGSASRRRSAA